MAALSVFNTALGRRLCLVNMVIDNAAMNRNEVPQDREAIRVDAELDLRGVICPYNFVKTKLKLEMMEAGQTLAVILDDGDPIKNVPRSVSEDGHIVILQQPWAQAYRVIIQKRSNG